MAVDPLGAINSKISGAINVSTVTRVISWILLAIILIGACIYAYIVYRNRKLFNKRITAFEIINGYYQPVLRDKAKVVKIGTGGFEILYLQKLKTWKVGYGGRVGKNDYYFFILPDGYWVNSMLYGDIKYMDKNGGLVQVLTTNPSMRAQYTSLEKQIEALHADKKSFMDKYGTWVFSIAFVMIVGVFAWLIFREMHPLMGQFTTLTEKLTTLVERLPSCPTPQNVLSPTK